eukprot:jgi/Ulvmu1/6323/UM029_0031.1
MNDPLRTALADLVPHLVPATGSTAEERTATAENIVRYAHRIASNAGPRPPEDANTRADVQALDYVGRNGNDAPGFSAKLGRLKQTLSNEDRNQLLGTLLQVVKSLPGIVRQPRLHIPGLADATNLPHRQQEPLQPQPAAGGPASVHSSHQGPFTFHPSQGSTMRHQSPPRASRATTSTHGSPSAAPAGPISSYAPSFTASQIHPAGTSTAHDAAASSTTFRPPSTLEPHMLTLTRHVLSSAHQVSGPTQESIIKDVLTVCQGIQGRMLHRKGGDGSEFEFTPAAAAQLTNAMQANILMLCELGWLYKLVMSMVGYYCHSAATAERGIVHQAFADAVMQSELRDFYRLIAMLGAMAQKPPADGPLTTRRLRVWLQDPTRRMRVLAHVARQCEGKKGGEIATAVFGLTKCGCLFQRGFATRLLRPVCVPLLDMINRWIYEGTLDDAHQDFFVAPCEDLRPAGAAAPAGVEAPLRDAWHSAYELRLALVPAFIDERLAEKILRAGKSINFLRGECDDVAWVQQAAKAAHVAAPDLGEQDGEPVAALRALVERASSSVDEHLKGVTLGSLGFLRHCEALKGLLLFSHGDFLSELLSHTADLLPRRASEVMASELSARLKKAIDASNVQHFEHDMQERLALRKAAGGGASVTIADVMQVTYTVTGPLASLMPERVMMRYEQISTFLLKLKTMEFQLQQAWQALRRSEINLQRKLRGHVDRQHTLWLFLRHAHRLVEDMNSFCQHLRAYVLLEVVEGAWAEMQDDVQQARNIDEVMDAHDKYLGTILSKAMLDSHTEALRGILNSMFDCCARTVLPLRDAEAQIAAKAALLQQIEANVQSGEWGAAANPHDRLVAELATAARAGLRATQTLHQEHTQYVDQFMQRKEDALHLDLRFLAVHANLNSYFHDTHRNR